MSNKTCVLHIGMPKTGSTSIQRCFECQRDKLPNKVRYADFGPTAKNHVAPIMYAFKDDPNSFQAIAKGRFSSDVLHARREQYSRIFRDCLSADFSTIVFSAEGFHHLAASELEKLKSVVIDHVDRIKVLAYVRAPISYMESVFQQRLKNSPARLDHRTLYPHYRRFFENFEQVFGAVDYRTFSSKHLVNQDVVHDFCAYLDIPPLEYERHNSSLGLLAVKFMYTFRQFAGPHKSTIPPRPVMESALSGLCHDRFSLPSDLAENTFEEFAADMEWMAARTRGFREILQAERDSIQHRHALDDLDLSRITSTEQKKLLDLASDRALCKLVKAECGMRLKNFVKSQFTVAN